MIEYDKSFFLNQLKMGSASKRYFFDTHISKTTKPLVKLLQQLNVLRRFYLIDPNKNTYRVFPSYSRHRNKSRNITLYTRVNGRLILGYQALRLIDRNTPHSAYILETSQGLMTQKEAVQRQLGGKLLLIVR